MDQNSFLENVWDQLLSRDKNQVLTAFSSLDEISQKNVLDHLSRMVKEEGWHPEQVKSAQSALNALEASSRSIHGD